MTSSDDATNKDFTKKPTTVPPVSQLESIMTNAKTLIPIQKLPATPASSTANTTRQALSKLVQSTAAGLVVALAVIPQAVAFSFVAGVPPLVGLWSTVTLGFVAPLSGSRPGICSSASGACSVVVAALCASHGAAYLSACASLAGLLQVMGGVLRLGKFIRLVPHPVMLGFVNGLAVVMTKTQLHHFRGANIQTAAGASLYGIAALTMVLVKVMHKILPAFPPTLLAVALSTIIARLLQLPVTTLADVAGAATSVGGTAVLPTLAWWPSSVPFNLDTLRIVFPFAATMAVVGCIESLLTMQLLDGMLGDGRRGSTTRECLAQGLGNVASGMTGGIGGSAALGLSIINVHSGGGVSRWSGMSMALFLAIGIVVGAPLLAQIPVAALVGVMLLVCHSTFSWSSLRVIRKIPKLDALVIALVSVVTVQRDLAHAVLVGTVASALGFAWTQSTTLTASTVISGNGKEYAIHGPLFFGSTRQFQSLFDCANDPQRVTLDFSNSRVMDYSALEAIHSLADAYGSLNKTLTLRHVSPDCATLLAKMYRSGELPPYEIIQRDPETDPEYGLAVNYQ